MKEMPLSRGLVALLDDDDYEWASALKWYALDKGRPGAPIFYAVRNAPGPRRGMIYLHTCVVGRPDGGMVTDHINGNSLDNRRENLRFVLPCHNNTNSKKRPMRAGMDPTSDYKGVTKLGHRWRALIKVRGVTSHIGLFSSEMEAARAWDDRARALHGQYARPNFPESS